MDGKTYAVLIGVNTYEDRNNLLPLQYAEQDCKDLYKTLTNSETGTFLPDNSTLLLGSDATTDNVWETLFREIVHRPTANDTVLVYFSGHGFIIGERQRKAYLGTYDVNVADLLKKNMRAGLRMDDLHKDIFTDSPAKNVIFILDSCYSGAFAPSIATGKGDGASRVSTDEKLIDRQFFSGEIGRIALVSCPPNVLSYESSDLQNSVFTHYLIEGLKGGAAEPDNGEVTLDSLLAYLRNHAPSDQRPGRYGQDYGRIVLANPSVNWKEKMRREKISLTASPLISGQTLEIVPLSNPLKSYEPFIENLITLLKNEDLASDVGSRVLEVVRLSTGAEFVAVLRQDTSNWIIRAQSSLSVEGFSSSTYIENIILPILPAISTKVTFNQNYHGVHHLYEDQGVSKALIFIPLVFHPTNDLMIVCGLSKDSQFLGEVCGRILSALYLSTRELTTVQVPLIEAAILDNLKQSYGFVPLAIYDRRFELFCDRLKDMIVHFEPILYLDPDHLYIDSWEALARNPESVTAPTDLFKAAELWGDRFMIELDSYFIRRAVTDYHKAFSASPGRRRAEDMRELSVNVYPQSLVRTAYFNTVKQLIKDKLIQPEKLILEISEKLPLPPLEPGSRELPSEAFRRKLEKYVRELRIGFAIDDFGVGHSSISRLTGLNPAYVKIDREILHQEASDITLRYVLDLASRRHLRAPKVVIEGFDSKSPITLNQLYRFGVPYVQGYIVGKAGSEPNRLEPQQYEYLKKLINDDEIR